MIAFRFLRFELIRWIHFMFPELGFRRFLSFCDWLVLGLFGIRSFLRKAYLQFAFRDSVSFFQYIE